MSTYKNAKIPKYQNAKYQNTEITKYQNIKIPNANKN